MNPNKQRIAIAEACRWTRQSDDSMWFDDPTNSFQVHEQDIPDYLNDLNAMHERRRRCYTRASLTKSIGKRDMVDLPQPSLKYALLLIARQQPNEPRHFYEQSENGKNYENLEK